jgi:dihydroorotase
MPNLKPPVTTVAQAAAYRERILAACRSGLTFSPLMTLYLTDNMPAAKSMPRGPAASFMR